MGKMKGIYGELQDQLEFRQRTLAFVEQKRSDLLSKVSDLDLTIDRLKSEIHLYETLLED